MMCTTIYEAEIEFVVQMVKDFAISCHSETGLCRRNLKTIGEAIILLENGSQLFCGNYFHQLICLGLVMHDLQDSEMVLSTSTQANGR